MRRLIAVMSLATVFSAATAAGQDQANAGRAYLGFSFGGQKIAPRDFHYGLRFDYDSRFASEARYNDPALRPATPLMQFDFTRRGLAAANLNGLSVLKKAYTLKQNEGAVPETEAPPAEAPAEEPAPADGEAAPAEDAAAPEAGTETGTEAPAAAEAAAPAAPAEEGFFARSWHGVKNFFGMGDKPATETAAKTDDTPAEQAPAENPADVAQGTFMGYNAIDWATLAAGAVGVGFIVSEVSNGKDSPDAGGSGSGSGGGGGGGGCPAGQMPNPLPGGPACIPVPFAGTGGSAAFGAKADPDFQEWLDGGTGHMGDLGN